MLKSAKVKTNFPWQDHHDNEQKVNLDIGPDGKLWFANTYYFTEEKHKGLQSKYYWQIGEDKTITADGVEIPIHLRTLQVIIFQSSNTYYKNQF